MHKIGGCFFLMIAVVACSHGPRLAGPIQPITDHPRVVYRSLHPDVLQVNDCAPPDVIDDPAPTPLFIHFPADRWNLAHGDTAWKAVYQQLDAAKRYLVVGMAKPGEAGSALVAQRRANIAAGLLIDAGFPAEQLHLLASWGHLSGDETRGQGVVILEMPSDGGVWGWMQTVHSFQQHAQKGGV